MVLSVVSEFQVVFGVVLLCCEWFSVCYGFLSGFQCAVRVL